MTDSAKLYAIAKIAYGRSVQRGWDSLDEHEKDRYAEIVEEVLNGGIYDGMTHYEELVNVASEAWDAAMNAVREETWTPTKVVLPRNAEFHGCEGGVVYDKFYVFMNGARLK